MGVRSSALRRNVVLQEGFGALPHVCLWEGGGVSLIITFVGPPFGGDFSRDKEFYHVRIMLSPHLDFRYQPMGQFEVGSLQGWRDVWKGA